MAVVEALDIEPHHHVLDIAAAPGGKSTHAASRLGPDGFLLVNDVVSSRMGPLLANLDVWGYPNSAAASTTVPRLVDALPGAFDRVIVDAPCSGEALFRRDPASRSLWTPAQVRGAARRQGKLLAAAANAAAPGALLAYTTCTFDPAENEEQVDRFLAEHSGWAQVRSERYYPHLCRCEGQFVSVLRAPGAEGSGGAAARGPGRSRRAGAPPHPAWTAFAAESLRKEVDPARVLLRGKAFYLLPPDVDLPPAAALRPGLPLGLLVGTTFRPAHAFAMTLGLDDVVVSEPLDGDDLTAFRTATAVRRPGPPGWILATMGRWPIGWGQRKGDEVVPRIPRYARGPRR